MIKIRDFLLSSGIGTAFVLDHATFAGITKLREIVPEVVFPTGYEHSIGNTDIAIIGINKILPSHWNIKQISDSVHRDKGIIVYLHPMKGTGHWDELKEWITHGYIDVWEFRNGRCKEIVSADKYNLPAVCGMDLHDEEEIQSWTQSEFNIPAMFQTLEFHHILFEMNNPPLLFPFLWGNAKVVFSTEQISILLVLEEDFDQKDCSNEPYDGNCFEFVSYNDAQHGVLTLFSLFNGKLEQQQYELSSNGIKKRSTVFFPYEIKIDHRIIQLSISKQTRPLGIAFSINRESKFPAEQRLSWPSPVWPPRSYMDSFIL